MNCLNFSVTQPRLRTSWQPVKSRVPQYQHNQLRFQNSVFSGQKFSISPIFLEPQRIQFQIQAKQIKRARQFLKFGPGKKWERQELHPKTGKPIRRKLHVQVGDKVIVIAGKEKKAIGTIMRVQPKYSRVFIEGLNLQTKNRRGLFGKKGEQVKEEGPIHSSNVMHYSEKEQVRSRIGHKFLEDGTKVRYLKKTGEILPKKNIPKRERPKDDEDEDEDDEDLVFQNYPSPREKEEDEDQAYEDLIRDVADFNVDNFEYYDMYDNPVGMLPKEESADEVIEEIESEDFQKELDSEIQDLVNKDLYIQSDSEDSEFKTS